MDLEPSPQRISQRYDTKRSLKALQIIQIVPLSMFWSAPQRVLHDL